MTFLSTCEKLTLIFDQGCPGNWGCVCIRNQKYLNKNFLQCSSYIFLDGAPISTCEDAESEVNGGSSKYFWINLCSNVERVTVEIKNIQG